MQPNKMGFSSLWSKPLSKKYTPTNIDGVNFSDNQFKQPETSLGSVLSTNFEKTFREQTLPEMSPGLKAATAQTKAQGLATSKARGPGFGVGQYMNGAFSLGTGIADISAIAGSDMTNIQKRINIGDSAVNTASQVASAFGPIGAGVGLGLNLINSIGGNLIGTPKAIKNFGINDQVATSSSFGGVTAQANDTAASSNSYKNAGLFGKLLGGKNKLLGKVSTSNNAQSGVADIINDNQMALARSANSSNMFATNNTNKISGLGSSWFNGSVLYGQEGGILFKPLKKSLVSNELPEFDLNTELTSKNTVSKLAQLEKQRKDVEAQNKELEQKTILNENTTELPAESVPQTSGKSGFESFEIASLQRLQALNPGKKVEVKFENQGVYNSDGSRNWETQQALLNKGASKTGLSLHNFGAAKDYRLVVDGKTISPSNTKLYKDVLWSAAKDTGLHTIGEWDVAHIGLAPEGKGQTWKHLHENHPEVFNSQVGRNTIASLKKAGQSKYLSQLPVNKEGGTIHIKKKNKGKFTEYKKRTGKTTEEALHSSDPKVRKMANFAKNAKKFKHQMGGQLMTAPVAKSRETLVKDNYRKQYGNNPIVVDPMDEVLSAPQKSATWAFTGKYQTPGDAMNIQNPYAKTAVDFVLDPVNLLAVGKLGKIGELNKVARTPQIGVYLNKNSRMRQMQILAKLAAEKSAKAQANALIGGLAAEKGLDLKANLSGNTLMHKEGGSIKAKNVIVHGKLHAHKHTLKELKDLSEAEITRKGIPVITKDSEGGVIQHSEVEGQEVILHLELTQKLEALRAEGTDEAAIKAGKLLARELMRNTKDKTGTLRSIKNPNND